MQKTYVALSHFKDPELGLVTRRQLLENLPEEKVLEMKGKGLISPVLQAGVSDPQVPPAITLGLNDITIDSLTLAPDQAAEPIPKFSKKNASASKKPGR